MSQYGGEVGFEGRMLWLPSHVLDDPCEYSKVHGNVRNCYLKQQQSHSRFPSELQSQQDQQKKNRKIYNSSKDASEQYSKSTSRSSYERPKPVTGGHGMQAIFLGSGQRSCGGTGVFLPQKAGTKPTKKPACAPPVLLPARVIDALNLKVDALGLQISPPKRGEEVYKKESTKKKNQPKYAQYRQSSSQDIFLPKEWTY